MTDRLVRGVYPASGFRAVLVRAGDTARMSRALHGLYPTSARLFGEGLAAALLVAALQKDRGRVNLQLECDGPARGLFLDASPEGEVRGYARAPAVHFPGDPERGARAALGTRGYLSVIREASAGGFQRGSVELLEMGWAGALRRWFAESEQVETVLDLAVVPRGDEPLGDAGGLLVQKLPGGDAAALDDLRARLGGGALREALASGLTAQRVLAAVVGEGFEVAADLPVRYVCGCSAARARVAVSALGRDGVEEILADERRAVVTCEFCRRRYVLGESDLRDIAARLGAGS
ncbi:MAG TPA: Hsp33 family molecular chaperone HslO [Anaeromyxobacteraceae bacterium]